MIYIFERAPINISADDSLQSCYLKNKTSVPDSLLIAEIERKRIQFYSFFCKVFTDKNFLPSSSQIATQRPYLLATIDLMEIGERANLTFVQTYTSFLNAGLPIDLQKDNRSVLLCEYILSRYAYALASIRSLKKPIQEQMKNLTRTDSFRPEEMKEIIDVYKEGFLRLVKLHKNRATIWVSSSE